MQKCLLNVLVYQEPVIFSINCVVPEFSLPYYCSVSQSVCIDCRSFNHQMALFGYRVTYVRSAEFFALNLTLYFLAFLTQINNEIENFKINPRTIVPILKSDKVDIKIFIDIYFAKYHLKMVKI